MINHPIIFHRDFQNDFPPPVQRAENGLWDKCQRVAFAALPLISIHRPFRGPLSLGMSCLRSVTSAIQMVEYLKEGNIKESSFHFLHASLATAAAGLFFFNPVLCLLSSSISDFIIHSRHFIQQTTMEPLAFMILDLLFLTSFCYGSIEITIACMVFQLIVDGYLSAKHFKQGNYFDGACQAILASAHMHQMIPQLKVLHWKWKYQPVLEAELKQNQKGFVYLDIPDEYVHSLFELYKEKGVELPPYFEEGKSGAHVSVILSDEMKARAGVKIEDLGKKFHFRIVNMDCVKPDGWEGIEKVYFLTLSCSEMESLRSSHGFTPKIQDHDFHLTFGLKKLSWN